MSADDDPEEDDVVDIGKFAKKAQDALAQGSDRIEAALKDNAGKIEGAVDKAGQFAKEKMPDRAAQIDNATQKAKAAVPRHEDGTGASTGTGYPSDPPAPSSTGAPVTPTHTAADSTAPSWSPPGAATPPTPPAPPAPPTHTPPTPPSPTPEVDRAAREQG
ncbi:antitoxin [Klenkia sp. PcliD-1-E]|uniref:antitoxin n=1 Tax=Klenkia sp. PcliD-1-E TaxID=2954492 RepID=UPI00209807BA|nr:antitoxin [Klenkia sp. PcliD-1-E]MCO7221363.1 antitoxin [Klenkia sp. PcliD-1-E]